MSKLKAQKKRQYTQKKTPRLRPYVFATIAVIAFAIIVFTAWFLVESRNEPNTVEIPRNVNELVANATKVPEGAFEMNMTTTWNFKTSQSTSKNAYIANSPSNHYPMYFTISLKDTGKIIYTSPEIPLGCTLKNITLNCDLPAGTYDTVVIHHLLDESGEEVTDVHVSLTIIIEK